MVAAGYKFWYSEISRSELHASVSCTLANADTTYILKITLINTSDSVFLYHLGLGEAQWELNKKLSQCSNLHISLATYTVATDACVDCVPMFIMTNYVLLK